MFTLLSEGCFTIDIVTSSFVYNKLQNNTVKFMIEF